MKQNTKIFLSDDMVDFIKSYNAMNIRNQSETKDNNISIYWIEQMFLETEDPNIFEIIDKKELINTLLQNRLNKPTYVIGIDPYEAKDNI